MELIVEQDTSKKMAEAIRNTEYGKEGKYVFISHQSKEQLAQADSGTTDSNDIVDDYRERYYSYS